MTVFEQIQQCVCHLPGKIGLYVSYPGKEQCWGRNQHLPLVAASVIKLPVMVEAFRQREEGELDFARQVTIHPEDKLPSCGALTYMHPGLQVTVEDLVTLMIILSDNTATNLLIDLLGMEKINRTIHQLGLQETSLNRKLFQPELSKQGIENYVSAGDMGLLLEKLLKGQVVNRDASAEMLSILKNQRLNGKLPFFLHSRGIVCAHKTGEDSGITHDVGVIFSEEPCVVCFLSNETDVPQAERAIQDVAALAAGI